MLFFSITTKKSEWEAKKQMPSPFAKHLNGGLIKNRVFFNNCAKGQQRRKKHEIQIVYNLGVMHISPENEP